MAIFEAIVDNECVRAISHWRQCEIVKILRNDNYRKRCETGCKVVLFANIKSHPGFACVSK